MRIVADENRYRRGHRIVDHCVEMKVDQVWFCGACELKLKAVTECTCREAPPSPNACPQDAVLHLWRKAARFTSLNRSLPTQRPGFRHRVDLPKAYSSLAMNSSSSNGLPVRSCRRSASDWVSDTASRSRE